MNPTWMRKAIELSLEGMRTDRGGPFGAVIVRHQQLVSVGQNQVASQHDPTAHAEIQAIRAACQALQTFQLTDCELYTSCEPCPMCLGAIYWARPQKVYYAATRQDAAAIGFDDAFIYAELHLALEQRHIPYIPLLREEALVAFQAWGDKTNKVRY